MPPLGYKERYSLYLASDLWRENTAWAWEHSDKKCSICGDSFVPFDWHHALGYEFVNTTKDRKCIRLVCAKEKCHYKLHRFFWIKIPNTTEWLAFVYYYRKGRAMLKI